MKKAIVGLTVLMFAMMAPSLFAQEHDHGEVGAFGDYFRLGELGNANFLGLGGRAGFNVAPHVQLEGQMAYDFARSFDFVNDSTIGTTIGTTISRSSVTLLHGLFGPKFILGTDHARFFGTVQGGFLRFGVNHGNTINSFTNSINSFGDSSTHGAMYPGVGGELYVGPVGLRLDVGDFIYFRNGAQNNLSVRFGPQIKF